MLPSAALALVALLEVSAFATDVGLASYGKRRLYRDAASLAGARDPVRDEF